MEFRIADTFTDSLDKLTNDEQKAVKLTAFDLQTNPAHPGLQFHRIDRTKDKNFWSVRVSRDIRVIVHKTDASLMLCYVDHHDDAYAWAERRKLERHPKTGAAQLVEVREKVRTIEVPRYVDAPKPEVAPAPPLFAEVPEEELLGYGVPEEWLADARAATEDTLLDLTDHLPSEASEALLELATGNTPAQPVHAGADADPFEHPDAQRRFRVMTDKDELERALDYPWEKWTVFLHPAQRDVVEREYTGPARVAGSAGTGKTVVALHRAAHLVRRHPDSRVLLTTFSDPLANALRVKLRRLIANEPRLAERIDVEALDAVATRLHVAHVGPCEMATDNDVRTLLSEAAENAGLTRFSAPFLWSEWSTVVDAWQVDNWEEYRTVKRLGRKTRLAESQRRELWAVFDAVRARLADQGRVTMAGVHRAVAQAITDSGARPYDFAIVDEAQDVSVPQLRFLAALGAARPDGLFFAGDLGQRIFRQPFSWSSLGVEIRGRSSILRVNYRTSHQIRTAADRLLALELADVDGNKEDRRGTVSVFNGPVPEIQLFDSASDESEFVGERLAAWMADGMAAHEMAVFVRSDAQLARAEEALRKAGVDYRVVGPRMDTTHGKASLTTMHRAKGLEFRAVAVMACDDEVVPLQDRIETVTDDSDLEEVYNTERHLLYVACTRARDHLLVTAVEPGSEFLEDMA